MKILDIHTHHSVPQPDGVVSLRVRLENDSYMLDESQAYSVGIHPWDTESVDIESRFEVLDTLAEAPEVVAIGEAGIDLNVGGPLYRQLNVFRHNVELSERLAKPLVIHDVKAHDVIIGARRDLKPSQPWAIHGFRQNPRVLAMLLRAGLYISFGPQFNAESLREMPAEFILAETDDSEFTIDQVIARLADTRNVSPEEMTALIGANTARFLNLNQEPETQA